MSDNSNTTPLPSDTAAQGADATKSLFGDASRAARPEPAQPWTAADLSAPGATADRLRPRFGTILWGVILLVFAAFMVTNAIVPFTLDPGTWIIGALVAGGVVLVAAGTAAAIRRTG